MLLFSLLVLFSPVLVTGYACTYITSDGYLFNISSIPGDYSSSGPGYSYYSHFCGVTALCSSPSCQTDGKDHWALGDINTMSWSSTGSGQAQIEYSQGTFCANTGTGRVSIYTLSCAYDATVQVIFLSENPICTYNFAVQLPTAYCTMPVIVSAITPPSGKAGTSITITGYGFGSNKGTVMLGDYNVENIAFWNETKIVCTVPIGVGSNMRVLVTHQDSRKSVYNNYWSYSSPTVTAVTPTTGWDGDIITITGTGFGSTQNTVTVNGVTSPSIISWADLVVVCVVPVSIGLNCSVVVNTTAGTYNVPNTWWTYKACAEQELITSVDIISATSIITFANMDLIIPSDVQTANCPQINMRLQYEWIVKVLGCTNSVPQPPSSLQLNTAALEIPAWTLKPECVYEVGLNVAVTSSWANQTNSSKTVVNITVYQKPLVAAIAYGDRLVSAFLPLVLDASSSFDPDTLQTTGLHYHWDCFDVAAPTSPCPFSAPLAEDKAVVTIPASSLVGGKSYVFGVTVHKDDKATTVTVTIVVVANFTVPQVGVEANASVPSTDQLILRGWLFVKPSSASTTSSTTSSSRFTDQSLDYEATLIPPPNYHYKWSSSQVKLDNTTLLSDTESAVLVLKENALKPNSSVTINCTVLDTLTQNTGWSSVVIQTFPLPSGGVLQANFIYTHDGTPDDAVPFFMLSCSNVVTKYPPLQYDFGIITESQEFFSLSGSFLTSSSFKIRYFTGSNKLTAAVRVRDASGSLIVITQDVDVSSLDRSLDAQIKVVDLAQVMADTAILNGDTYGAVSWLLISMDTSNRVTELQNNDGKAQPAQITQQQKWRSGAVQAVNKIQRPDLVTDSTSKILDTATKYPQLITQHTQQTTMNVVNQKVLSNKRFNQQTSANTVGRVLSSVLESTKVVNASLDPSVNNDTTKNVSTQLQGNINTLNNILIRSLELDQEPHVINTINLQFVNQKKSSSNLPNAKVGTSTSSFVLPNTISSPVTNRKSVALSYNQYSVPPPNLFTPNVSSVICSLSIKDADDPTQTISVSNLTNYIAINITRQNNTINNTDCRFWDAVNKEWRQEGCVVGNITNEWVICLCDHLTEFTLYSETGKIKPNAPKIPTVDEIAHSWWILLILFGVWCIYGGSLYWAYQADRKMKLKKRAEEIKRHLESGDRKRRRSSLAQMLKEGHMVFGTIYRTPDDPFTRPRRIGLLFTAACVAAFTNVLFLGNSSTSGLDWVMAILIGLYSNLIALPIRACLVYVLLRIKSKRESLESNEKFMELVQRTSSSALPSSSSSPLSSSASLLSSTSPPSPSSPKDLTTIDIPPPTKKQPITYEMMRKRATETKWILLGSMVAMFGACGFIVAVVLVRGDPASGWAEIAIFCTCFFLFWVGFVIYTLRTTENAVVQKKFHFKVSRILWGVMTVLQLGCTIYIALVVMTADFAQEDLWYISTMTSMLTVPAQPAKVFMAIFMAVVTNVPKMLSTMIIICSALYGIPMCRSVTFIIALCLIIILSLIPYLYV